MSAGPGQLANVSAIIAAYDRFEQTATTIAKVLACVPAPAEVLVHVDANQHSLAEKLAAIFPGTQIILSPDNIGPGGGRNKLLEAAGHELVASFDDDSYPLHGDFFTQVTILANRFPDASIFSATILEGDEGNFQPRPAPEQWVADFTGCGCVYRRSAFLQTAGYVPLPVAYGMEEVDLAIRLHAAGGKILGTGKLQIFHDTNRSRQAHPLVTAQSIANIALLVFLRYPLVCWPIGFLQLARRIFWLVQNGRWPGIVRGLLMIPQHLRRHKSLRRPVKAARLGSYLMLRRRPAAPG